MRGGCGTSQIGTDDQPVRNIGTTINIQFTQCVGRLANLPLSDFVEGNVDLALQTMLRIVGGTSVTHQRDGVHVFRYCAVMLKFDVSSMLLLSVAFSIMECLRKLLRLI